MSNNHIYLTSDQHFFHDNIIKYCDRPYTSYTDMNKSIINNYNKTISPNDTVIHLGDLSANVKHHLSEFKDILNSMNGRKILLRGNHDHQDDQFYLDNGFEVVGDHMIVNEYFFSHYPLFADSKWCTPPETRLIELYKKSGCTKIVHGHTHNNVNEWPDNQIRINTCVEVNNYRPVLLNL